MTTPADHEQEWQLRMGAAIDELRSLAVAASTPSPRESTTMTATEETVAKFIDRLEAGDIDGALSHCDPDIHYTIPGRSTISGSHVGAAAIVAALQQQPRYGATELTTRLRHLLAQGPRAISVHELIGSLDGQPVSYELVLRFELDRGRIASITEYTNDQYLADSIFTEADPTQAAPEAPVATDQPRRWRALLHRSR